MVKDPKQKKTTRRAKFQLKQQKEMAKFKALQAKLKALQEALQEALQAIEYQEHCDLLDSLHAIQLQKLRDEFALAKKLTN